MCPLRSSTGYNRAGIFHSAQGLATDWTMDRIPAAARYSATVQTGPVAHPASYTMGTLSFPGLKRPGRGVDHLSLLNPRLKEE